MKTRSQQKTTFRELLLAPDKKKGEATNVLAILFRDMLIAQGIMPSEWEHRVERYFTRLHTNAQGEVDKKRVDQDKSNLTRALTKDRLPLKRFEEGVAVLGAESVQYTVQLNFPNNYSNIHKVLVRNRYVPSANLEDDDDEDEEDAE